MIKEVYLMTNRNCFFFDENGDQIHDLQKVINWSGNGDYPFREQKCLELIIKDNPTIYLSKWNEWTHFISIDEFCSLLGHGPWYYKNYRKPINSTEE